MITKFQKTEFSIIHVKFEASSIVEDITINDTKVLFTHTEFFLFHC